LSLGLIAARLFLSFSGLVRLAGLCSQVCPFASFQKAILLDFDRTCSGPTPFLAVSYSAASAGYNDGSELQMQAFFVGTTGATAVVAHPVRWRCHKQVWLTFWAVGTTPVHHLAASCCGFARIKPCCPIPQTPSLQGACSVSSLVVC